MKYYCVAVYISLVTLKIMIVSRDWLEINFNLLYSCSVLLFNVMYIQNLDSDHTALSFLHFCVFLRHLRKECVNVSRSLHHRLELSIWTFFLFKAYQPSLPCYLTNSWRRKVRLMPFSGKMNVADQSVIWTIHSNPIFCFVISYTRYVLYSNLRDLLNK